MGKHGTASLDAGQFAEFASVVIRQLPRDMDPTTVQGWIENQSSLQRVLREVLVPPSEGKDVYHVVISYAHTFSEMIQAGHYDGVNDDITPEHFPITGEGIVEVDTELLHFNRFMESDDVLKEMDKAGFRPAKIEELLAFGAKYPEKQREFPIVALGSVWRDRCRFGDRFVAGLWRYSRGRVLRLGYFAGGWGGCGRFLAVRK